MIDPRGGVWIDRYDDHVLTSPTTPGGATTSYRYDAQLQLIGVEAPRGARSTLAIFSGAGRLLYRHIG